MQTLTQIEIPKYPYLGYSPNIIEYFLIIGFEKNFLKDEVIPNFNQDQKKMFMPTVLNTISSNYLTEMLDNDIILKLLFPKPPGIFTGNSTQPEFLASSVIFFLNGDTVSSQSKIPFHGYGFLFYEQINLNNTKLFIPKAFCIISQYPYFTFFSNFCKEVLTCFKNKNNEIPLEVLLYNIVNFTPSPINCSFSLNLFPHKDLSSYVNTTIINSSFCGSICPNSAQAISPTYSKNSQYVPQLSGYPILDFNLSEIFNLLPMPTVVEVLVFNFLEFDMVFFSKNLEILNMVMYIIAALNYPCNDTIYQWHILSVSKEDLLYPTDNKFVSKPFASMIGVNCSYDTRVECFQSLDSHFIVDLDNKNFFFKYSEMTSEVAKGIALQNYIRKILTERVVQSVFLEKHLKNLIKELDVVSKQVIHSNYGYKMQSGPTINFFESGEKILILNKKIQESFYDFILNILTVFYNNYTLNSTFDRNIRDDSTSNKSFFIHLSEDFTKFAEEEVFFCELFKGSNKYNNYILNFIQDFKCIPLYKVPLMFSEEFIYIKKNEDKYSINSHFFEVIEKFYSNHSTQYTFLNEPSSFFSNNKRSTSINFSAFFAHYEYNWKCQVYQDATDSQVIKARQSSAFGKTKYYYDYEYIELDSNVLFKYVYLLNNLPDEKREEIFPSIANQRSNEITGIKPTYLVDTIERNLISQKIIKHDHLIEFSLLIIFAITRNLCNFSESIMYLSQIVEMLKKKTFFIRKYINIILNLNCQTILRSEYDNRINRNIPIMCNFLILNFLRSKNILPNEQMMYLFENCLLNNLNNIEFLNNDNMEETKVQPAKFKVAIIYNFCRDGTKKEEYFLRLAENNDYDGNLFLECDKCKCKELRTALKFQFDNSQDVITTEIFSPLKLYNQCHQLLELYNETFDYMSLDMKLLDKIIVNLIFYAKNLDMSYQFLLKLLIR